MSNQELISRAKKRCADLALTLPNFYPLQTVMEQLSYIEAVLLGQSVDRSHLESINIGMFAVREFESRAPDFANMLYEVEDVVKLMKSGKA